MQINPRQVEAFRLVMLRGSVTLASQELNISQPAVSRLLRDFELRIGFPLFERRGNHLAPTPEAALLLAEVERSFTGLREIANFAANLNGRRTGALRIVALPAMATRFIPRIVSDFAANRELQHVYLHGMPSHLVVDAVVSGQAEVGLAAAPVGRPALKVEPIAARAVVMMPAGHVLATRKFVAPGDLAGERFISISDGSIFGARINSVLGSVARKIVATTPLCEIACSLVQAGTGIAVVDPFSANGFQNKNTVIRPFRPAIDTGVVIVTSALNRLSLIAEEFIAVVRDQVAMLDRAVGKCK